MKVRSVVSRRSRRRTASAASAATLRPAAQGDEDGAAEGEGGGATTRRALLPRHMRRRTVSTGDAPPASTLACPPILDTAPDTMGARGPRRSRAAAAQSPGSAAGRSPPVARRRSVEEPHAVDEHVGVSAAGLARLLGEDMRSAGAVLDSLSSSIAAAAASPDAAVVRAGPDGKPAFATVRAAPPPADPRDANGSSIFHRLHRADKGRAGTPSPASAGAGARPASPSGGALPLPGGAAAAPSRSAPSTPQGQSSGWRGRGHVARAPSVDSGGAGTLTLPPAHKRQVSCPPLQQGRFSRLHAGRRRGEAATPSSGGGEDSRLRSRRARELQLAARRRADNDRLLPSPPPCPSPTASGTSSLPPGVRRARTVDPLSAPSSSSSSSSPPPPQLQPSTSSSSSPSAAAAAAAATTLPQPRLPMPVRSPSRSSAAAPGPPAERMQLRHGDTLYAGQRATASQAAGWGTVFYFGELAVGPGLWAGVLLDAPHGSDVPVVETPGGELPPPGPSGAPSVAHACGSRTAARCYFAPADGRVSSLVPDKIIRVSNLRRAAAAVRAAVRWTALVRVRTARRIMRLQDGRRGGGGTCDADGPFASVDLLAAESPPEQERTVAKLVSYLTQGPLTRTGEARVRAVLRWLCEHVSHSDRHGEPASADDVLRSRLTTVRGFSVAFSGLAAAAGFPCVVVRGYGRDMRAGLAAPAGGGAGRCKDNHFWCLVQVDGAWFCVDPAWSAGYLEQPAGAAARRAGAAPVVWRKHWSDAYFMTPPALFALQHLPVAVESCTEDAAGVFRRPEDAQLLPADEVLDRAAFFAAMPVSRAFVKHRMHMLHPVGVRSVRHTTPYYTVSFEAPTALEYLVEVRQVAGRSCADGGARVLDRCWHVQTIPRGATGTTLANVFLVFPEKGEYQVRVRCKVIDREVFHWRPAFGLDFSVETGIRDIPVHATRNIWVGFIKRRRYHGRDTHLETQFRLMAPFKGYFELGSRFALVVVAPKSAEELVCVNNGRWWQLRPRSLARAGDMAALMTADETDRAAGGHVPAELPASDGGGGDGGGGQAGSGCSVRAFVEALASAGRGDETADPLCSDSAAAVSSSQAVYQCDMSLERHPEVLIFYRHRKKYRLLFEFMADQRSAAGDDGDAADTDGGAGVYLAPGEKQASVGRRTLAVDGVVRDDGGAGDAAGGGGDGGGDGGGGGDDGAHASVAAGTLDGRTVLDTWGRCFEAGLRMRACTRGRNSLTLALTTYAQQDLRLEFVALAGWGGGCKLPSDSCSVQREDGAGAGGTGAGEYAWVARAQFPETGRYTVHVNVSSSGHGGVFRLAMVHYVDLAAR